MTSQKSVHAPADWAAPLAAYTAFLRLRDLSQQSIDLRTYHVRMLGAALQKSPWNVTLDDLTTFIGSRSWGNHTSSAVRSSIKVFYAWAEKTGRVTKSPATDLPRVKPPAPKPNPIPEDDLAEAIAKADPYVAMALRLAGSLGMRRGEVCAVHEDDLIDSEHGHLLRILGKGRKERIIPIGVDLARDLRQHIATTGCDGWAFPRRNHGVPIKGGGHISPHWLGTLVARELPDGYTMHKLRHRALTQAYARSKDILLTSKLAGHSSVATTQAYYVAPDYTALRSIVEGIAS